MDGRMRAGLTSRKRFGILWRKLFTNFGEIVDIGKYAKQWCLPESLIEDELNAPSGIIGNSGIDLCINSQLLRLQTWEDKKYANLFQQLRKDRRINTAESHEVQWIANGFYPTPDAECYAAMILDMQPEQIIEVGSGYSTRIAKKCIQFADLKTKLKVIDPKPRADIRQDADEVILERVEKLSASSLEITGRTILFIDSSHICRTRGDVPYLFCQVIPNVPKNTVIHFHDIYLPYDYPVLYDKWLWNEQYLLFCLLSHSKKFKVLLTTHLLSRQYTDIFRSVISPRISPETNQNCGGAYWIQSVI